MTPTLVYLLYGLFALGGAGLYFLLPRTAEPRTRTGLVLGLAAAAGFTSLLIARLAPDPGNVFFYLFALIAVLAAARVVTHPVPVYSALYFVLVVVAVAALLVLQGAEFAAIALIIVYAGAILVTYLFVIMLAQQEGSPVYDRRAREPFMAVLTAFVLTAAIAGRAGDLIEREAPAAVKTTSASSAWNAGSGAGNTKAMGDTVMTKYVVALELAAVLLLVAMVGAIAMSRKKVSMEGPFPESRPLGEVGKEVEPF